MTGLENDDDDDNEDDDDEEEGSMADHGSLVDMCGTTKSLINPSYHFANVLKRLHAVTSPPNGNVDVIMVYKTMPT